MGKKSKIEQSFAARHAFKSGRKKIGTRKLERYVLIVCEGAKTEPNYFKAIQSTLPRGRVVIDIEGTGMNTLSLVEEVIKHRERAKKERNRFYDESWAVFDKDSFPDQNFNSAIAKATSNNVLCAWSNEAFELWYILHFQYRNTAMSRVDYQKCISDEISSRSRSDQNRRPSALTGIPSPPISEVLKNSKKLLTQFSDPKYASHNPCTLVFKLVESLNQLRIQNSI